MELQSSETPVLNGYNLTVDRFIDRYAQKMAASIRFLQCIPPTGSVISLVSNNYLALNQHPAIANVIVDAYVSKPNTLASPALIQSRSHPMIVLEHKLARFTGYASVAVCQSGWTANFGLLKHLAAMRAGPVYIDSSAHSSLYEGAKAGRGNLIKFRHNDMNDLEALIRSNGPGVIVVDAMYSTNGDLCPLADLVTLAERFGCSTVVDEAHSFGAYGTQGQGYVAALGLTDRIDYITASLGKCFASRGGLVASREKNIRFFKGTAEPYVFSSKMLPHEIAQYSITQDIIIAEEWRRLKLQHNARQLRGKLAEAGFDIALSDSHIIGLSCGTGNDDMVRFRDLLFSKGIVGSTFVFPATPRNQPILRLAVRCDLTDEEIQRVASGAADCRKQLTENRAAA